MASPETQASCAVSLPGVRVNAGFVAPVIGRIAAREVLGSFGLPLIYKGDTITKAHMERALAMGRQYELIASTREES